MNVLAKALIAVSLLLVMGRCTFEYHVVDACFDAGNVYDYAQGLCRSDVDHIPPPRYFERFSSWLIAGGATFLVGIALLNFSGRKAP